MQAYCVKEKGKKPLKDPKYQLNSRGRPYATGTCGSCGSKLTLILGANNTPPDLAAKMASFKKGSAQKSRKSQKRSRKSRKSRKH